MQDINELENDNFVHCRKVYMLRNIKLDVRINFFYPRENAKEMSPNTEHILKTYIPTQKVQLKPQRYSATAPVMKTQQIISQGFVTISSMGKTFAVQSRWEQDRADNYSRYIADPNTRTG